MMDRFSRVIQEKGGIPCRRGPDSLIGVWTGQKGGEDHPERAVRAALALRDLQRKTAGSSPRSQGDLVRFGVQTDIALIGSKPEEIGWSPAGEAVDAAVRLASSVAPGEVLLGHGTYRHLRGVFDVQPLGSMILENREDPLEIYLLERAKPRSFRIPTRGVEGIETRTVGRDKELRGLQERYREAAEASKTQIVLATGEAGVGKSRLLEEFQAWLELLPETILFFRGKATPATVRSPNGLFRDVFSFRFEIRETDSAEAVRDKFRTGMADFLEADRADVVGQWLGFDFSGSEAVAALLGSRSFRPQALADLVGYFRAVAAEPLVIILEDLHWADDGSLFLLEHLAAEIPDGKLLVVGVGRPLLAERTKTLGAGNPAISRMELSPLTLEESSSLVEDILRKMEEIPDELRELIVEAAGGNPFYLEELIGLLVDRGIILVGAEKWKVNRAKLSRAKIPTTLGGVMKARLQNLPAAERRMLQCASVVGRQFWDAALADLSTQKGSAVTGDRAEMSDLLAKARERNLIFRDASAPSEESGRYVFKHDLLRDFVYGTVLGTVKRTYHAQVARWLERNLRGRYGEHLTTIAEHFEAAGDPEKASEYLLRAGREMVKVSLFREGLAILEKGIGLLPANRSSERAGAFAEMADAFRQLGEYPQARSHSEKALATARDAADTRTEITALNILGRTGIVQGEYAEAKQHLAEALALATRTGDRERAAQVLLNLADASFRLGDANAASSSAREALQVFKGLKDSQGIAGAHRVLGFASMMEGDNPEAAHHHQQGLEIFEEIGDRWGVATCLINLGEVHRKMGKSSEAVGFWERSLPISKDIGARLSVAIGYLNMGGVLAGLDKQELRARKTLREGIREAVAIGAVPIVLEGLVSVALLHIREGDPLLAAKLLGTVTAHPAFNAEIQEYSDPLLKRVEAKTGADALRTAMDWGRGRDFGTVVEEVLKNLEAGASS